MNGAEELNKYLGGVILFEETVDQKAQDGTLLPKLLMDAGIIPGIKLDKVKLPLLSGLLSGNN